MSDRRPTRRDELLLDRALGMLGPDSAAELEPREEACEPDEYELAAAAVFLALEGEPSDELPASLRNSLEQSALGFLGRDKE